MFSIKLMDDIEVPAIDYRPGSISGPGETHRAPIRACRDRAARRRSRPGAPAGRRTSAKGRRWCPRAGSPVAAAALCPARPPCTNWAAEEKNSSCNRDHRHQSRHLCPKHLANSIPSNFADMTSRPKPLP